MKSKVFLVAMCITAASCDPSSDGVRKAQAENLIVRFAADGCEEVKFVKSSNSESPQQERVFQRYYEANVNCVSSLRKGMSDLGFSRESFDTFSFKMDEDSLERIIIIPRADNSSFEIRWEETYP